MRILIVEDDPVLADGLTRSLRQADFAVDCAHDGETADHILAAQNYDLVILDLGLPKLDGFDVLKRLRRRGSSIELLPENPDFEPIEVDARQESFAIEGIAVGVIRSGKSL